MTEEERDEDMKYRIVLCGASAYDKKYYYNHKFDKLPENIQEELRILCVLFTEEIGGIFTVGFTPEGEVVMDTSATEGDYMYDEIGAGLMIRKIRSQKQDLFQALAVYYKVTFLHMNPSDLLDNEEDSDLNDFDEPHGRGDPNQPYTKDSTPEDLD